MRTTCVTHTLQRDLDEVVLDTSSENLALVDRESYPAFLGRGVDYFDMMAHLSGQMRALTAIAWKAPTQARRLRVRLTGSDRFLEQNRARRIMIASGNLRCFGRMVLANHERLFDSARHRTHGLLQAGRLAISSRAQILDVPPGIYSVFIYYQAMGPNETRLGEKSNAGSEPDYEVLLRHYPFPPPRSAPVRLSSQYLSSLAESTTESGGQSPVPVITSHARIW